MGLLSRASTMDNKPLPVLAFSDFINKYSLKTCALLEPEGADYIVTDSIGFDAYSIITSKSTIDFWEGICKEKGQLYIFSGDEKTPLLQLFSINLKDKLSTLSVYKNSAGKILLYEGKLSEEAIKDFENVNKSDHQINVLTLNPLLKDGSFVLLFKLDFSEAISSFYESQKNKIDFSSEVFNNSVMNEIYNRFACQYNISDSTIKLAPYGIKTVIFTDKNYSVDLITQHIILNLREVLDTSADLIQINYSGTADSCEKIEGFLQAD